jgi:hypothetical protein
MFAGDGPCCWIAVDSKSKKADKIVTVGCPPQGMQGLAGKVEGGDIKEMDIACDNGVIHVIDGRGLYSLPIQLNLS